MGTIVEVNFDHGSSRATKARLGRSLGGLNERLLVVLTVVLLLTGIGLVVLGISIGWLIAGLAAWPAVTVRWYRGELHDVSVEAKEGDIGMNLQTDVLARLPNRPTPQDVATALMQTQSGLFYAVRFGVTPNFLQGIASSEQSDTAALWQDASALRDEMGYRAC